MRDVVLDRLLRQALADLPVRQSVSLSAISSSTYLKHGPFLLAQYPERSRILLLMLDTPHDRRGRSGLQQAATPAYRVDGRDPVGAAYLLEDESCRAGKDRCKVDLVVIERGQLRQRNSGGGERSFRHYSAPSPSGNRTSRIATSGRTARTRASASVIVDRAVDGRCWPCGPRRRSTDRRIQAGRRCLGARPRDRHQEHAQHRVTLSLR
jgi:hypothetical protein